jgi:hypothetical protein
MNDERQYLFIHHSFFITQYRYAFFLSNSSAIRKSFAELTRLILQAWIA